MQEQMGRLGEPSLPDFGRRAARRRPELDHHVLRWCRHSWRKAGRYCTWNAKLSLLAPPLPSFTHTNSRYAPGFVGAWIVAFGPVWPLAQPPIVGGTASLSPPTARSVLSATTVHSYVSGSF